MTVTSDSYIQNITNATGDIMNQQFTITFPIENEDEVFVWEVATSTGVLTRIKRGEDYQIVKVNGAWTLEYIGATPHYNQATIRLQRHLLQTQPNYYNSDARKVTPESIQKGFDETLKMIQQTATINSLDAKAWSLGDSRITNLASGGTTSSNAVTKKEVDDLIGGGTSPMTIGSSDVGKWATANSSGGYTWSTFQSTDDPKGQEYKYLTAQGWKKIDNIADISGSGDNNKLLTDVNGVATWATKRSLQSESEIINVGRGKVWSVLKETGRSGTTRDDGDRSHRAAPYLLPNERGNRLLKNLSLSLSGDDFCENEWGQGQIITQHTVSCRARPEGGSNASWYSGIGEKDDSDRYGYCDHPVYLGTFDNIYGSTNATVYLMSWLHQTEPEWFVGLYNEQLPLMFPFFFNIVSITSSTVTFVAASALHEVEKLHEAPTDLPGSYCERHIKHPEVLDISFNCLWNIIK